MRRSPPLLKWLTPVVASLFALVSAELLARFLLAGDNPPDHLVEGPGLPMRLRANYEGRIWDLPVWTNGLGFRSEAGGCPSDEAFCVLSLGDSIGFGVGVEAEEHYSQVAEHRLRADRSGTPIEVLNAGSQGYSPSSYLVYYRNEGRRLRPDLVVVEIELCNDISDEALLDWAPDPQCPSLPRAVKGGRYVVAWDGNLLGSYSRGPYWYEKTYLWSMASRAALELWEERYPNPLFLRPDIGYYRVGFDRALLTEHRIEQGRRRLFAALRGLRDVLRDDGVELFVLVLPARFVYEGAAPDHQRFAVELMTDATRELTEAGIAHLDLRPALQEGQALYLDFVHLNAKGNEAAGQALAREVESRFLAGR